MSSPYLRIGSSEASLADNDGLAEELIARMALYDAALVESADAAFLETAPLSPPLQSRWGRLKSWWISHGAALIAYYANRRRLGFAAPRF